jgi:hypothetical protein
MESQDKSPLKRTGDNSALYFSSGDGDGFKAVAQAKESTSVASSTLFSSFFDHRFLRLSVFGFGRYATSAALTNTEQLSGVLLGDSCKLILQEIIINEISERTPQQHIR